MCATGARVHPAKLNYMVVDFEPTIARLLGVEMAGVDSEVIDAIADKKRQTEAA